MSKLLRLVAPAAAAFVAMLAAGNRSGGRSGRRKRAARGGHGPGNAGVPDPSNLYSETDAGKLSPAVAADLPRVYVPNLQSNDVYVIDPETMKVVDSFRVGLNPQHVVPSWDLRTLWVANNAENTKVGSLTPIDPRTGKPGKPIRGGRSLQHVLLSGRQVGDRRRRGPQAARFPRSRRRWRCNIRSTSRAATASTTPTSRSTGVSRSSPASSPEPWRRSTS